MYTKCEYMPMRKMCTAGGWGSNVLSFFFFIILNYILLIMVLQLSWFSPLCPPPPSTLHSLSNPPTSVYVMHICSLATPFPILYFTSPWLFCNHLFVLLNPLTSSPIVPNPLPSGSHQNALHVHDSVLILHVCLVCFLDSIVDRYVFVVILLFIGLIFFFLNKSL